MLATIIGQLIEALSDSFLALGRWLLDMAPFVGIFAIQAAPWVLPAIVLLLAAKFSIMAPMRRSEAAHALLDLLEMGLAQGRSPENTIVEIAATNDKTLGKELKRLAERIQAGASLGSSLESVPDVLPEPVAAMLRAGERLGDIRKVLPPCRDALAAGQSRAIGAFNYLPVFSPWLPILAVAQFIAIVLLPKFTEIHDEFTNARSIPLATQALSYYVEHNLLLGLGIFTVLIVILITLLKKLRRYWPSVYLRTIKPLCDRCLLRLPWRHKRMQRDFSAMLAILLDAGIPESEAVTLAAQSTANCVISRRARTVVGLLQQGVALTEAIRVLDDTGEFQWRLANAVHGRNGFLRALQGWHDTLDAQAYRQEQSASQVISTMLIVLNGVFTAVVALAIFQPLIAIIQYEALW